VYTDAEECFSLIYNGEAINPEPSQRVIFYMPHEIGIAKMKMSDGQLVEKKFMVTNTDMGVMTYEIVKNEKKGTFDTKTRYGQSQMTPEAQQKQQQEVAQRMEASKQKLAQEQQARDDAWDAQINEQEQRKNNQVFESDQMSEFLNDEPKVENNPAVQTEEIQPKHISVKGEYPYQFKYDGRPLRQKMVIADYRDTDKQMMGGETDNNGVLIFKTDLPYGVYKVD
jgi:hypothetical protein